MFSRKIVPSCAYCRYATSLGYDEYFCVRRGIMGSEGSCGKYSYEPTKRVPLSITVTPATPEIPDQVGNDEAGQ